MKHNANLKFCHSNVEQFWDKTYVGESNQGNKDSSRIQKNVIQGQRQDMENRQTQQRT